MKYVGSKSRMLSRGLGEHLETSIARVGPSRIVDLFSGSCAVGGHLARRIKLPVLAVDAHRYAAAWGHVSIEASTRELELTTRLLDAARLKASRDRRWKVLSTHDSPRTQEELAAARRVSSECSGPTDHLLRSYGGHFFSPSHALALQIARDAARGSPEIEACVVAALTAAAVGVSSSPGHMAQPLKSANALPFISAAWGRDIWSSMRRYLANEMASRPLVTGTSRQGDVVPNFPINSSDWVFLDPPYSTIQYSRLYHVLEGIATGGFPAVSGVGRMPEASHRSVSVYSLKSKAVASLTDLVLGLLRQGAHVALTVPAIAGSNGVGADSLLAALPAANAKVFTLSHSSLGNGTHRAGVHETLLEFD